eukprot:776210-Prymnesium_polylepis.2
MHPSLIWQVCAWRCWWRSATTTRSRSRWVPPSRRALKIRRGTRVRGWVRAREREEGEGFRKREPVPRRAPAARLEHPTVVPCRIVPCLIMISSRRVRAATGRRGAP